MSSKNTPAYYSFVERKEGEKKQLKTLRNGVTWTGPVGMCLQIWVTVTAFQ